MFLDNKLEGLSPVYPLKQLKKTTCKPLESQHKYWEALVQGNLRKTGLRQTEEQLKELCHEIQPNQEITKMPVKLRET